MAVNAVFEGAGGAGVEDGMVLVPTFGTVPIRASSGLIRHTSFGPLRSQKPSLIEATQKTTESKIPCFLAFVVMYVYPFLGMALERVLY